MAFDRLGVGRPGVCVVNSDGMWAVVFVPNEPALVAGVRAVLRTAQQLLEQESVEGVFLCGASEDFPDRKGAGERVRRRRESPLCGIPEGEGPV